MKDREKRREVEVLLGGLAEERYALLVNLGKKITDWGSDEKMQTGIGNDYRNMSVSSLSCLFLKVKSSTISFMVFV